jgi:very-short-patch-repair endonuclease
MNLQQRHLDELIADYTGYLIQSYAGCARTTESPIEALMLWAILHVFRYERIGMAAGNEVPESIPAENNVYLVRQARIGKYRADFAIMSNYEGVTHKFVVECDGHDFHERTKEQAERDRARDRAMLDAGWKVYRFTGSEIYRSPLTCADSLQKSIWRADL